MSSRPSAARQPAAPSGRGTVASITDRISLPVLSVIALVVGIVGVAIVALISGASPAVDIRVPKSGVADLPASGRSLGRDDAPVTIEVWSDFQCPACGLLARQVEPAALHPLIEAGTVRLVYRDLAFLGPESMAAAMGGRYAAEQGRFWPYHDIVFANQEGENKGAFRTERLVAMAKAAGLDPEAFQRALTDPTLRAAVVEETQQGNALGVRSTPTMVIDGVAYAGVPDPKALVELVQQLAQAG